MAFELKPFAEMIALTKEKLDESLAPVRARLAKARAEVKIAELEEKQLGLEKQIQELCSQKEIDFDRVIEKIDSYELTERKSKQVKRIVDDLFPKESK